MSQTEIIFIISFASFCIGVLHRVWLMSMAVASMRHSFEVQDIKLAHLGDVHVLAFNGFRERMEHTANRHKQEVEKMEDRLDDIEGFLTKSTEFNRHK